MCLGIPGQILTIAGDDPLTRTGRVNFGGVVKEVNLAFTPDARVGEYVVVHVGFAISKVDEEEAGIVFDYLRQMGELNELEEAADGRPQTVDGGQQTDDGRPQTAEPALQRTAVARPPSAVGGPRFAPKGAQQ